MKLLVLFTLCVWVPVSIHAQKNQRWKALICRQEAFSKSDSILFCHLFDSLNKQFSVGRIVQIKSGKNRFLPLFGNIIALKGMYGTYSSWIKELSHAVQFSEREGYYKRKAFFETTRSLYRYIFCNKRFRYAPHRKMLLVEMYDLLYEDKKSFEYEAHEIIEPAIRRYLAERMKTSPR